MGKNAGKCKFCKEHFANKYHHESRCSLNPNKKYVKCKHCQVSILQINMNRHHYCSTCNRCFNASRSEFGLHNAKHAKMGKVFSKRLEKLFSNDQSKIQKALNAGGKFVDEIKKHFKDSHNREKKNYYVYLILKMHKEGLLSFEEFCECILYVGRGTGNRIDIHGLGSKEFNDGLRAFFEQCYEEQTKPIAFIPFVELLSDEASSLETSILRALDPSNLANIDFGSMSGFEWTSDEMAVAGACFLHKAYEIYLKTPTNLDRKMNSRALLFEKPDKWHIKLNKKELIEKEIYIGEELMKKSNPKDARYVKLPSNITADQITQVLAFIQSLNTSIDEKEPDEKSARIE